MSGDNKFYELLESEYEDLEESEEAILDFLADSYYDDYEAMKEDLGLSEEEYEDLSEQLRKHVDSSGKVTKKKSRKKRSRKATLTTGLSKAQLRMRGRKAAKSRKKNPSAVKKGLRKRKKSMRKRKAMGLK